MQIVRLKNPGNHKLTYWVPYLSNGVKPWWWTWNSWEVCVPCSWYLHVSTCLMLPMYLLMHLSFTLTSQRHMETLRPTIQDKHVLSISVSSLVTTYILGCWHLAHCNCSWECNCRWRVWCSEAHSEKKGVVWTSSCTSALKMCLTECLAATCICQSCLGRNRMTARYVYGIFFLLTNVLAWMVRDYSHKGFTPFHCKWSALSPTLWI